MMEIAKPILWGFAFGSAVLLATYLAGVPDPASWLVQ